jgi:hypothetical protein
MAGCDALQSYDQRSRIWIEADGAFCLKASEADPARSQGACVLRVRTRLNDLQHLDDRTRRGLVMSCLPRAAWAA